MLKSGRIRILAILVFGLGLLFPPAWVLCVEPTGEVRVENVDIACCDGESSPAPQRALIPREAGDCEGCQDVTVLLSAVRATRAHADQGAPLATPAMLPTPLAAAMPSPARRRGTAPAIDSARQIISVTILRR